MPNMRNINVKKKPNFRLDGNSGFIDCIGDSIVNNYCLRHLMLPVY